MDETKTPSLSGNYEKSANRRQVLKGALAASVVTGATTSLTTPAIASNTVAWRMVTSWPKNLPGPGITAQRLADRIGEMSGGRLVVKLHAAGEIVPAFGVFDAVATGVAELAHTASFFWQGKLPAAAFFTAVPFGLTPLEHITWIEHGGGQALWDQLYAPFEIKPFMAGNTGMQMGGWYKNPITSISDLAGLKIRMPGLGGEVIRHLGATPISLPPSEILPALQSGLIDATEFLGPFSDGAMGFHKVAKHYHYPGFHEPNGTGEALVSSRALAELPNDLQAIVKAACAEENMRALGESEWNNASQLIRLVKEENVSLQRFPDDVLTAAKGAAEEVLASFSQKDDISREILSSYLNARKKLKPWSSTALESFISIR